MEVLIVSKTHMSNTACVGGLVLSNNRYVRLLNQGNNNQPTDSPFEIGQVWDLNFADRTQIHQPHIEDVVVSTRNYLRTVDNIPNLLRERNLIDWKGHIDNVFGGLLHWTNSGTGYIPLGGQMPVKSVGFWLIERDLIRVTFDTKTRFRFPNGTNYRNISYVGYQETIATIPSGTVLRVSLSRIFPPEVTEITAPRGYYLQLSGWYAEPQQITQHPVNNNEGDLPF